VKPVHTRITLAVIAAALTLGALLWISGSAVVIDSTGSIVSATITDSSGATQPLHRLPGGLFYTIPRADGAIVLCCRNGAREQWGYVTPYLHSWLHVRPGTSCGRVGQPR
jgi:hypothetical protein